MDISARLIFKILGYTAAFVGVLFFCYLVRHELVWIGTAFFLTLALNPAVEWVARFMPKRNRLLATTSVFLAVLAMFAVLVISFVPPLVHQTEQLSANFPKYIDELGRGDSFVAQQVQNLHLGERIRESQSKLLEYASSASGSFFNVLKSIFSSFIAGLTVLGLTFFMLLEGPAWVELFWKMFPARRREHGRKLLGQMYTAVIGYVNGNILTSVVAAVVTSVVLAIVGVPYAIPLGLLVGLFDLLPLVGATIGAVIVIVVSLFTSAWAALFMLIFFVVYQQVENHVIQPLVYGKTVQMSPLLVLISVLIGAGVGGILGALIAIPVAASLQILVKDYASRKLSQG